MSYTINTGKFEKGTHEQQAAFVQLFGPENIQYKFDFYFHWYNIVHEYGHCLCSHYDSNVIGLKQELLVNSFAVGIWKYAGYEKELKILQKMLGEILQNIKNPVPDNMSFTEYYEQIWETDQIMEVPIYGYFQFKSVQMALEDENELETVFKEMGIHKEIDNRIMIIESDLRFYDSMFSYKEYLITAETAKEVLNDLRDFLNNLGIEQPVVNLELVDNPSIHCVKYNSDFSD